ncbi:hypothetical protein B0J12DRAFT_581165 [Macrophomina phaseolina]|uniref:Indole-diterpene biosynthesis protein PaxU n=1 Tax=Macrophomina phaseolina TaxID=35725 RepID=A0ABQ8FZK8_9PEZI|nr:hypothetical protein B0J12DRAFT_581165 [Macrophomina phaseolina]
MADKKAPSNPLPNFQRLNHKTWLYDPAKNAEATAQAAPRATGTPDLILLCAWMDASLKHVAKYTTFYQALYPASPILLLTSATSDFFFNTAARQKKELAPALAAICSYIAPSPGRGLLVHSLSNGGSGHLAMLCEQYRRLTGSPLPASTVIYDSAPGRSRFRQGLVAMSMGLPTSPLVRWPLQALVALLLVVFFHIPPLLGIQTLSMRMRDVLNDGAYLRKEAPRLYIYSESDAIILAADVEDHADEAEKVKGMRVQRAVFEGTAHVGHMRQQPDRYRKLVAMAWETRC